MQVISVNGSVSKEVAHHSRLVAKGIFKDQFSGRIGVRHLGLVGDGQTGGRVHGGIDMAVYAYPLNHYGFWERALGRGPMPKGSFGENLTVQGLLENGVRMGGIFPLAARSCR